MTERKPDFSGWATKSNIECSDGRTILSGAFKHQDKARVPLVWQHDHKTATNVLGHADLENRAFGVYAYGFFNESEQGQHAKELVEHGDINALSIFANKLKQRAGSVLHGNIIELSLVYKGANPGAMIENVGDLAHTEDGDIISEAIIYTGLTLEHQDKPEGEANVAEEQQTGGDAGDKTVKEIFDTLSDAQKDVVYFMVGEAVKQAKEEDDDDDGEMAQSDNVPFEEVLQHINNAVQEGITTVSRNVFDANSEGKKNGGEVLSHGQFADIVNAARKDKTESFMDVLVHGANDVLEHAEGDYGITDIQFLFPDAKALGTTPDFIAQRMEWVNVVLTGTKHVPFAKVKSIHADITEPEARAKGYIKGKEKKEEVIKLLRRSTGPATVYKKQKLDRDDILDITDFDVVVWLQAEIRLMLEAEIARAILTGDGRSSIDEDKIQDPEGAVHGVGIRSILHDSDLYAHKVQLPANVAEKDMVKGIIRARTNYRGTGKPTLFISDNALTDMMLLEDKFERPLYETEAALADKLRVSNIVTVEMFDETENLLCILVNLADYTVGANKGGEITNFEDFDIDFNQNKYLAETRISGALTKPKSAIVVTRALGQKATPSPTSFDSGTNVITIPTVTGVLYSINQEVVSGTVTIVEDTEVTASPDAGYFFEANTTRSWTHTYTDLG